MACLWEGWDVWWPFSAPISEAQNECLYGLQWITWWTEMLTLGKGSLIDHVTLFSTHPCKSFSVRWLWWVQMGLLVGVIGMFVLLLTDVRGQLLLDGKNFPKALLQLPSPPLFLKCKWHNSKKLAFRRLATLYFQQKPKMIYGVALFIKAFLIIVSKR